MFNSILDNDLYKIAMGQFILRGRYNNCNYDCLSVKYQFINRDSTPMPDGLDKNLVLAIKAMADWRLSECELVFLKQLSFLKRSYIDFLSGYRFDPSEVEVKQEDNKPIVGICGPWYRSVLWEVPLMALISELFHFDERSSLSTGLQNHLTDDAYFKGKQLIEAGCHFSDFGTRRRYSSLVHELVIRGLVRAFKEVKGPGSFLGTSNMHLARVYGLKPIGTQAHEIFMAHATLFGYQQANDKTLRAWHNEFGDDLAIALSDTFTTDVFFRSFIGDLRYQYKGLRQDSGDPIQFARRAIEHYKFHGINPMDRTIVFSDKLDVNKAIEINDWCKGKINAVFGIGTFFTCDVPGVKPLNMVIKMTECNGIPTIKLSDDPGKHTGDPAEIIRAKKILEIQDA